MTGKEVWKRLMTVALSGAMVIQGLPLTALAADAQAGESKAVDGLIASFDFDQEADGGGFVGGGAKATGNYALQEHNGGNALYLNGSQFLNVTAENGESLLTGKDEITISYDAKSTKGEKSWTFFAAPNANTQTYQQEHYLGILHTSGAIKVERYHNSGQRPGNNLDATVSNEWMHIDVVVTENHTTLYVNGEETADSQSSYKLSDILGANSILQIGKGNWESGEYYTGWIDNYRIYEKALSEEEIQDQYAEFEEQNDPMQQAYNDLTILDADDVRGNLALVREGKNGASISWESSNPEVITDEAEGGLYDGGVVTRPAAGEDPVQVELTATLTMEGYEEPMTKRFTVTVQPLPEDLDTDYTAGYLWAHFDASGGYEKIFFGYSEDGLTWEKLNKNSYGTPQPVLTNDAPGSDLGVRDPHLIRSPEGDKYWILGTDLHAEGGGAGGSGWNQLSASQNIVVWESTDLVNWSEPRLVYAGFADAGCVWAPEAIYDETTGDYLIYWSARDKSKADTEENALRVYVCRTRDFNTFSEPQVWLSEDVSGSEVNIIDSTIVEDNGKYYRFSTSDWNTVIDVSDTLDDTDVLDVLVSEEKSTPKGSWTRIVTRSGSSAAGFDGREGFTVYQLPDGTWCAMGDNGGYKAFVTDDLSKGTFTEAEASFPDGRFRHGTVIRLSQAEQEKIMEAYGEVGSGDETESQEPVLEYNFEQDLGQKVMTDTATGNKVADNGTLYGNAAVVYDEERGSNVLQLDGSAGSYGEIPQGFFDGRDAMSISVDVKSNLSSGNFFTFTYGKDSTYYNFLRIRGKEIRYGLTTTSWQNEQEVKTADGANTGAWQNVILTVNGTTMKLYVDGMLVSENTSTGIRTSDLGTSLLAYLGRSFYSGDSYFNGSYDNFKVYNRELTQDEILDSVLETANLLRDVTVGTVPEDPANTMGTDDHTAVTSSVNAQTKEVTSYVRKGTNLAAVPVDVSVLSDEVVFTVDGESWENGSVLNLTYDVEMTLTYADKKTETWTIKTPSIATNPVLPGQYADPDIDYFDGKYWIYPTTDGYSGWGGWVFHAFSSENLVDWTDEGVILDVKNKNPGENENGVQIASSAWSDGNAWAPSIEKKDGKYYFYYCGNINSSYTGQCGSGKAIGVAVSDSPTGPFVAKETPIVDPKMCADANIGFSGQVIDPSIFTDDDGTSYLFFGNGGNGCAMAELTDDMMSIKPGTLKKINGMTDFRESVVVTKRDGIYHFTWSCDDTGSPNYHVNYGTAEKLDGNVTFRYTLLEKDEEGDMLGTAHQSILYMPETDTCYIAYHRFYTPLGIYTDGLGYHRETCIEEITFDENGLMKPVSPTMEGARAKATVTYAAGEGGSIQGETEQIVYLGNATTEVTAVAEEGYEFVGWDDGYDEAVRSDADVQKDQTYTAIFREVQSPDDPERKVTVIYAAGEGGAIEGSRVQTIVKGENTTEVTAVAEEGYEFVRWDDGFAEAVRSDANVQEDAVYTAIFQKADEPMPQEKVTVTYTAGEGGRIEGTAIQTIEKGESTAEVTAVAEEGYEFVRWDDGSTQAVRSDANVQEDAVYTAIFQKADKPVPQEKVTVTYTAGTGGRIAGMATQTINKGGSTSQVTAVAEAGYEFSKWSDGKTTAARTDANVQQNVTYTAIFVKAEAQNPGDSNTETEEPKATGVKLNEKKVKMGVKEKVQLKATVSPKDASQKVTWKSSNKSVVAVSKNGKLTAKRVGKAKITVTTENGKTATCRVVVKKAPKKITAKVANKTLRKGKSFRIKVKVPGNTASYKIKFTSSKKSVASVSANGKVTAKKKGRAVITAKTYNGKKVRIVVHVK